MDHEERQTLGRLQESKSYHKNKSVMSVFDSFTNKRDYKPLQNQIGDSSIMAGSQFLLSKVFLCLQAL